MGLPMTRTSIPRFGTVVTGTLISGSVGAEDEVQLFPGGKRLRVRGVQSGGKSERNWPNLKLTGGCA